MMIARLMLIITLLGNLVACDGLESDHHYTVAIDGPTDTFFNGTCLVMSGSSSSQHDLVGHGGDKFKFDGSMISCNAQKQSEEGYLIMKITRDGTDTVGTSQTIQAYGVVSVAGT